MTTHHDRLFAREFGAGFSLPAAILELLATGELIDISWHNDVAPSFYHRDAVPADDDGLRLWVHPERVEDREYPDLPRYGVHDHRETNTANETLLRTDDLDLALAALRNAAAQIKAAR